MTILIRSFSVLSALLPVLQAAHIHIHPNPHIHRRQSAPPSDLPSNWTSQGCYTDNTASRTLTGASYTSTDNMTVESCINFCDSLSTTYVYAGVEYAQECYCGNDIENGGTHSNASECNSACSGDANEICGAGNRLNLYWSGVAPPPPPTTVPSVGLWDSLGCYNDSVNARALAASPAVDGSVDVESCTTACYNAGYSIAGMEYSTQCFCGLDFDNGAVPIALDSCNMVCAGNSSEHCGGSDALNVYNYTGTPPPPPTSGGGGGGGGGGTSSVYPVSSDLPSPWEYAACYVDDAYGRVMANELPDNQYLTVESCIASCAGQNYTLAGLEYSVQCFCADALVDGAVIADESDCDMGCGGNSTEACGGPNRLSVYTSTGSVTAYPVPVPQNTSLPGQWQYQGCLEEPGANRTFPYQIIWTDNNTVDACLNQCALFGYPAAGMEYGDECWCGDISDVLTNSPGFSEQSDCSMPCSGDPEHLCGGPERLQLYYWNGSLDVWHTPEVTGQYEFLIGGVVVPLLATLGINNKVAFLEKWGTSEFDNSTGAYELDLSLTDNFDLAWRTMHVKTDVFCSGAVVLPDRGARHLNVGGWSVESTYGVRLYTPDGSPGANGTNDWEENWQELSLQRGRWYPSALVLSNGSVLVVGGEVGSNGAPEPTLEILPTPEGGPTYMFLDYLNRTDPNNLYPFLHILPSGNIFIGYYNEARILDPVTFETLTVLPNMPGSVTSFLAGRTYPMEATTVMLPQYAPYTDPVTLLVCGGSNFGIALDNCVSIQPEVENPEWTIERMPSKRVMTCMSALPDGTFLIVNGAQAGVAGFGLGSDPNYQALLYDPTQPAHQRMSILNTTIVARMYHSESTLLPDGRVLISGSDPETPGLPEEMRVEVYIPPYLSQGRTQPEVTVEENDWDYGGTYQINVTLYEGTTDTMRVSLVAATSSTHGNNMGGRTLFPEFSCSSENLCTVVAPPNTYVSPPGWHQLFVLDGPTPSHSLWVRIGGDPAELGNWPNFPDFTRPGVGPL
ncbi:copper radical oxidase [Laetiporus sulphureus 93-53]|uniref:Copper radical oxidase n=1 Tax=Laetiporus sulphureus 93-53 TaxID=1314785 RepID=A0A165CMA5_9APHY|nr:copper radical oxidase [Laetiporus sulphureus 93-53]KZT03065.1 copper radical oxidase [Laetiporus sulphureus 93-53]